MLAGNSYYGAVDSVLYNSYSINDKRKDVFFKSISGRIAFTGSYYGSSFFDGLAIDELYLIRAECNARKNNTALALQDLNALLVKRWKTGQFIPIIANDATDALDKIIAERRKELCFRGIRWTDLRRLNKDSQFAKTITHGLLGTSTIYTLLSNDNKYVWPIPSSEVMYSNIPQNPR
ncbi:MAG: RagB/SusD family nutrient uptake outer membrane protein [Bacteroidota bacterium]